MNFYMYIITSSVYYSFFHYTIIPVFLLFAKNFPPEKTVTDATSGNY